MIVNLIKPERMFSLTLPGKVKDSIGLRMSIVTEIHVSL